MPEAQAVHVPEVPGRVEVVRYESWSDFKDKVVDPFLKMSYADKQTRLFRGHAQEHWSLKATLDRRKEFVSKRERDNFFLSLVSAFRRECAGDTRLSISSSDEDWEMLGRHHGLPTRLLDWSGSPYIGAFFAADEADLFCKDGAPKEGCDAHLAVFELDRNVFLGTDSDAVDIVDAEFSSNPRARVQRGAFTRLRSNDKELENVIPEAIKKHLIPVQDYEIILRDLDEMNITSSSLYLNLDGVARTVSRRLLAPGVVT